MARIAKKSGAYHHGDLRRVLLAAAIHVVEKEGVAALSLHAIAKKAGVSSGAPYHHFASREELLAAIAVEGFELLVAAMKVSAEANEKRPKRGETEGEAYLRGIGHGYVRFAVAHRGHFRIMFRPELKAHLTPAQDAIVDEAFLMLNRAVERCQRDGTLPAGDPRPIVLLAWSSVHGASVLWIDGPLEDKGLVPSPDVLEAIVADTLVGLFRNAR